MFIDYVSRDGDIIFVHGRMYQNFSESILPHINKKVILLSHGHTNPQPQYMRRILANPDVLHWFAINVRDPHPKVTAIPTGIAEYLQIHFSLFLQSQRSVSQET